MTTHWTFSRAIAGVAIGAAFALSAATASAASCSASSGKQTINYDLTQTISGTPEGLSAMYCESNSNDKNTLDDLGWTLGYSTDGGFAAGPVAGLNISGIGATTGPGDWSITWSNPPVSYGNLLLTIVQANSFAGYLLDLAGLPTLSGTWETSGPGKAHNSISHFSVWYQPGEIPPVSTVPLPGAAPLLLGALSSLGGLAALRRRKAKKD